MLSATKELPKEMLPVFASDSERNLAVKPILQLVFEQLHDFKFREFCFIVGREKRAIEDHFALDQDYLRSLNARGKSLQAASLSKFYRRISKSTIVWVNQHMPLGFGHAVLQGKGFVGGDEFLVHAGDSYVISRNHAHLRRLVREFEKRMVDAALTLHKVPDPRQYGVAEVESSGSNFIVRRVIEKPSRPKTNFAIAPIYVFRSSIFKALESIRVGKGGELQLTDGIQKLIDWGFRIHAIVLHDDDLRLDIGTPENYWEAQKLSHEHFSQRA